MGMDLIASEEKTKSKPHAVELSLNQDDVKRTCVAYPRRVPDAQLFA